jgi:hypothetical protein
VARFAGFTRAKHVGRFRYAILQQQVVHDGHHFRIVQLPAVAEHPQQPMVLGVKAVVQDLPPLAQLMGAGVDQRLVIQVFIALSQHWIDRQQRADQVRAALVHELVGVLQELGDRRGLVVLDSVRPQRLVVQVPAGQQRDCLVKERLVLHPERDPIQLDPMQILLLQVPQDVFVGSVLRDVIPRLGVDAAELVDHVQRERFGLRQQAFVLGHVDGIVREFAGGREVEMVFQRLRGVGLQIDVDAPRGLGVQDGDRARGDLQQHVQFLRRRGGVGDHDLAAVDDAGQEFLGDELVQPLVVLEPVAVAVPEEVLADQNRRGVLERLPLP